MSYELLRRFKAWADNEEYFIPIFRGKSQADLFCEQIVFEIGKVMEQEKFHFQNRVLIPTFYNIFISLEDSQKWLGIKRECLCKKLNNYVGNCLRITSTETFNKTFIQLCPTRELNESEVKIEHQWEINSPLEISFSDVPQRMLETNFEDFSEATIVNPAIWETEFDYLDADSVTVVRPSLRKLYSLEIWQNGNYQNASVFQPRIALGRGSPAIPVDIPLTEDLSISRRHAVLQMESDGIFTIWATGQNPVIVRETALFAGQTMSCSYGETIKIGGYSLTMRD